MLHPKQFYVNEAWIVFYLNRTPVRTEQDGLLNCLTLMDAASCYILGSELIGADASEPTQLEFRRLLKQGEAHKQQLPKKLFVVEESSARSIAHVAKHEGIEVVYLSAVELSVFIKEAQDGFEERFG